MSLIGMYGNLLVVWRASKMVSQVPVVLTALLAAEDWKCEEDMALMLIDADGDCLMEWRQLDVSADLFARLGRCVMVVALARQ